MAAPPWQDGAEIVAVGSELLTPQRVDTDSLYLTRELDNLGIELTRKCALGDNRIRLADAIRTALRRSALVILTGGLGPTEDDITREAAADALGRELLLDAGALAALEERFRRFGRKMADNNRRQAYIVAGACVLPNPRGTAPGQWIEADGRILILLPGPPHELQAMFARECLPRLEAIAPPVFIRTRFWRIAAMPESEVDALLAPVYTAYNQVATTILSGIAGIEIHLRAQCATEAEANAVLDELCARMEPLLGPRLTSKTGETVEEVVGGLLRARGACVAVAESATGGMLGERLTSVPGSSEYFTGGFLTYTDTAKRAVLGIPEDMLRVHTAVSEPVAAAMAQAARERTGADYGLSVTGYAGPEGPDVGLMFTGLATPECVEVRRSKMPGDRTRIRAYTCLYLLDWLRRTLLSA